MTETPNNVVRFSIGYVLLTLFAVMFTWELHEFAHWIAGTLLGYPMVMTLNTGYSLTPAPGLHQQLISAAGPVVTLLQAIVVFALMRNKKRSKLYPFLLTCLYCRLLATVMSFINPNDEARISSAMGLGKFTLPLVVTGLLLYLTVKTAKEQEFKRSINAATLGLIILFSSLIILGDQALHLRVL